MDNSKIPAFPVPIKLRSGTTGDYIEFDGLTKLEYVSAHVCVGLMSNPEFGAQKVEPKAIAQLSVELAKEILDEANK
jgi:hypothetical protein